MFLRGIFSMKVGDRIRQLRLQAHFSQNRLAEWAGVSQTHLRRVELGEADITVGGHLQLVCDALGVTLKEFFNVSDEEQELSEAIAALSPRQRALLLAFLKSL